MKKSILISFLFILLISILGYFIYLAKVQRANLFENQNIFNNLVVTNKEFNLYLESPFQYDNFDVINEKIINFENNFNLLKMNKNLNNKDFTIFPDKFEEIINSKISKIRKFKSYKAILNNSFRIIQKLKININSKEYEKLYLLIMTLDKDYTLNIDLISKAIENLEPKNESEEFFIKHANTILNSFENLQKIKKEIYELEVSDKLNELNKKYMVFVNKSFTKANISIFIIFSLLVILIGFYIYHEYKITLSNMALNRFKKTVENSDNIVVVTDKNQNIKYINDAFTKTTGYKLEEVIGKKPNILKSGFQSEEFYNNLHETIYSGEKWSGDFINIDRNGELSYEKASINPVLDENGEITEFIAIKLDITNETRVSQQLKEKEKILAEKSKITAMLDMIENIAHQWRQPLSVISTGVTGMLIQKEAGILSDSEFEKTCDIINENAQYLSKTIDDFNNFIKGDKNFVEFNLKDIIDDFLNLVQTQLKSENIQGVINIGEMRIKGYPNQLIQCFMNFFHNSLEAFKFKDIKERYIFIDSFKVDDKVVIKFSDNAGGIDEEILPKIFEPYFTSKHQYQGKGLGLHMNYSLITESMNGSLAVKNVKFNYERKPFYGAEFTIELPLEVS